MKIGSIGSSLVRWFKKPAPPPPPEMPQELLDMLNRLKTAGTLLRAEFAKPEPSPAHQHPDVDTPKWSWQQFVSERDSGGRHPGWAFCRFANRAHGPDHTEVASFVFGFARGAFGVWQRHMDVCAVNNGEHDSAQQLLTTITHLPSGYGVGVFAEREVAIEAAELAERVYPAWATEDVMNPEGRERTSQAWAGVGIMVSHNAHAHSPDDPMIVLPIYGRSEASVLMGKPEKLS